MSDDAWRYRSSERLRIGRWLVDPRADEIRADQQVLKLEPLKMRLLMALAAHPGEVVLSSELLDSVWRGSVVTPSSLYQSIAQLRQLLGDSSDRPSYIATVPRKGYRLIAAVERDLPAGDAGSPATPSELAADTTPADVLRAPVPVIPAPASAAPAVIAADRGRRRALLLSAGGLLGGVALAAGWWWRRPVVPLAPVRLAVMPFEDASAGRVEQALAEGLALDVTRMLAGHPALVVLAPEAVLRLADEPGGPAEAARRLQVAHMLVGTLRRDAQAVRLSVRLLEWPGDKPVWSADFDQPSQRLALLPRAVATEAVGALGLPATVAPGALRPSDAYEYFLLGMHALLRKTPADIARARDCFNHGIELDGRYARNYVGLGFCWLKSLDGAGQTWGEVFARAQPLFDKALQLEPELPEALTAQAMLREQDQRFDEARALFSRALEIEPGYNQARFSLARLEVNDGWPARGIEQFERAARSDPLYDVYYQWLALACTYAGRHGEAEVHGRRAIALAPTRWSGYYTRGVDAFAQGRLDDAVRSYREALRQENPRSAFWKELAWLYLDLGRLDLADQALRTFADQMPGRLEPGLQRCYLWAAQSERGERTALPSALELEPSQYPSDAQAADIMMLRVLARQPVSLQAADAAAERMRTVSTPWDRFWSVFQGSFTGLDLATVYAAIGKAERAAPLLEAAAGRLDRYERQGNVWPMLHFHRARIAALRGRSGEALAALDLGIERGLRRGWWLRIDPAFEALRAEARFVAQLARIESETARQRDRLAA